jgi:hypothetical protein
MVQNVVLFSVDARRGMELSVWTSSSVGNIGVRVIRQMGLKSDKDPWDDFLQECVHDAIVVVFAGKENGAEERGEKRHLQPPLFSIFSFSPALLHCSHSQQGNDKPAWT